MKKKLVFLLPLLLFNLLSCSEINGNNGGSNNDNSLSEDNNKNNNEEIEKDNNQESGNDMKINLMVNGDNFVVDIENSLTGLAFLHLLPMEIEMNELNGNEKYYYLDEDLPVDVYQPQRIETGDIMLFGSSCIVIFYESFNTNYSYTRIGKINNANNLDIVLGSGDVTVSFSK